MCGDCWWFTVGDNKINGNARIFNKHMEPGMIIELTAINPHSKNNNNNNNNKTPARR
jgi:hypothetical protein